MTIIFASFIGAILIGAADFYSGLATKDAPVALVGLIGQSLGLLAIGLLVLAGAIPFSAQALTSGVCAGACGSVTLLAVYKGLAIGRVAVVAPLSALIGAAAPVVFSLVCGHTLNIPAWIAIGLGMIAIYFLSRPNEENITDSKSSGFIYGLVAGITLGGFYIFLGDPHTHGNIWTIMGERITVVSIMVLTILARKTRLRINPNLLKLALIGGLCDLLGNLLYVFSATAISVHVVALITSLYPVSTLILGWLILKEPLTRTIGIGLACALVSMSIFAYQN